MGKWREVKNRFKIWIMTSKKSIPNDKVRDVNFLMLNREFLRIPVQEHDQADQVFLLVHVQAVIL